MKKYTVVFLIWVVSGMEFSPLSAQVTFRNRDVVDLIDMLNMRHVNQTPNILGTPYLRDSFEIGEIHYVDLESIREVPIRYNIYTDQIEFYHQGRIQELTPMPPVDLILLGFRTFVFDLMQDGKDMVPGYFELLADGQARLLLKYRVKYVEPKPARALMDPEPAKYVREPEKMYWKLGSGPVQKVKSLKKLIAGIGQEEAHLSEFAKENNISSGNRTEMARFFEEVNRVLD